MAEYDRPKEYKLKKPKTRTRGTPGIRKEHILKPYKGFKVWTQIYIHTGIRTRTVEYWAYKNGMTAYATSLAKLKRNIDNYDFVR